MSRRWATLQKMWRETGPVHTGAFLASKLVSVAKNGRMALPNTLEANLETWSRYDWSKQGEEWTPNWEWKQSLVRHVLEPNIPLGSRVLEIGPGAGRWTTYLVRRAGSLTLVDLTPECIDLCRKKFGESPHLTYFVNDGRDLSFIPAGSIDRIWSFDVFVHIQSADIAAYARQFAALLSPGGVGVIHHSARGANARGWRSDMTTQKMAEICSNNSLFMLSQFDSWDHGRFRISDQPEDEAPDVISIFQKPPAAAA